jgi:hypothetical protein
MKKRVNIHLIPTEKVQGLGKFFYKEVSGKWVFTFNANVLDGIPHQLIITDDSVIGLHDWYLDDANQIRQSIIDDADYWAARKSYKRIIASHPQLEGTASIKSEDIEWLVKQGMPEQVQIEMEVDYSLEGHNFGDPKEENSNFWKPKISGNGCISIVKDNKVVGIKGGELVIRNGIASSTPLEVVYEAQAHQMPERAEEAVKVIYPYIDAAPLNELNPTLEILVAAQRAAFINGVVWTEQQIETEAVEFAEWLRHSDNGDVHYDPKTKERTASIGYSPLDCYMDEVKTIEELYKGFKLWKAQKNK